MGKKFPRVLFTCTTVGHGRQSKPTAIDLISRFVFIVEFPLSSSGSTEYMNEPVTSNPLNRSGFHSLRLSTRLIFFSSLSTLQVLFCESASDCIVGPRMFLFPCFLRALFLQLLHLLLHPLPLWTMIRFTHLPRTKRVRHLRGQKISTVRRLHHFRVAHRFSPSTHVAIEVSTRAQLKIQSDAPTLNVASLDMIASTCFNAINPGVLEYVQLYSHGSRKRTPQDCQPRKEPIKQDSHHTVS